MEHGTTDIAAMYLPKIYSCERQAEHLANEMVTQEKAWQQQEAVMTSEHEKRRAAAHQRVIDLEAQSPSRSLLGDLLLSRYQRSLTEAEKELVQRLRIFAGLVVIFGGLAGALLLFASSVPLVLRLIVVALGVLGIRQWKQDTIPLRQDAADEYHRLLEDERKQERVLARQEPRPSFDSRARQRLQERLNEAQRQKLLLESAYQVALSQAQAQEQQRQAEAQAEAKRQAQAQAEAQRQAEAQAEQLCQVQAQVLLLQRQVRDANQQKREARDAEAEAQRQAQAQATQLRQAQEAMKRLQRQVNALSQAQEHHAEAEAEVEHLKRSSEEAALPERRSPSRKERRQAEAAANAARTEEPRPRPSRKPRPSAEPETEAPIPFHKRNRKRK